MKLCKVRGKVLEGCHLIPFINHLITINDVVGGCYDIIIIQLRVHTNEVRENVPKSVRYRPFQRTGRGKW